MNKTIIKGLEEETERLINVLGTYSPDSQEYKGVASAVNELCVTLYKEEELTLNKRKLEVESTKVDNDFVSKENQLDVEIRKDDNVLLNNREQRDHQIEVNNTDKNMQLVTLKDSKIWSATRTGIEIAGIVAPLVFYGIWMNRGLEFEKEGSFTSQTFKGLIGKFKSN